MFLTASGIHYTVKWKELSKTLSRCDELLSTIIEMDAERVGEPVGISCDKDDKKYSCVIETVQ